MRAASVPVGFAAAASVVEASAAAAFVGLEAASAADSLGLVGSDFGLVSVIDALGTVTASFLLASPLELDWDTARAGGGCRLIGAGGVLGCVAVDMVGIETSAPWQNALRALLLSR
jgi:hypothetical protein